MPMQCCHKSCKLGSLDANASRAEVKSAIPSGGLLKYKNSLVVQWKKNGEATFHRECWDLLLKDARSRSSSKKRGGKAMKRAASFNITDSEKVMIRQASKTVEMFDSESKVKLQAKRVAEMIKNANHCVLFTGAGISTSAGLGDFRGKGGKWTEQDRDGLDMDSLFNQNSQDSDVEGSGGPSPTKRTRGADSSTKSHGSSEATENDKGKEEEDDEATEENESIDYEFLRPTFTHEAIQKLVDLGHVKYLISQNCDGLHLLSGIPASKISELHGNVFVEKCEKCGTRFERPYYVCDDVADVYLEEVADYGKSDVIAPKFMLKCQKCGLSHRTGRKCEVKGCGGHLIDTIINFRDNLEDNILDKAFAAAESCDLLVCLGTTLMVTPASEVVDVIKEPQRIVICNRQATDRDKESLKTDTNGRQIGARVYGDCDVFMKYVMMYILGNSNFQKFEASLSQKTELYNEKRTAHSSN